MGRGVNHTTLPAPKMSISRVVSLHHFVPAWYVMGQPLPFYYYYCYYYYCGPGSSVGIATDYGLDDPGSNPGGDEIFRLSRPALEPTQPPVQ